MRLAVGTDEASAGGVFNRLDRDLANGLTRGGDSFAREVRGAGDAFDGVAGGLGVLTAFVLVGVLIGMAPRVLEYR